MKCSLAGLEEVNSVSRVIYGQMDRTGAVVDGNIHTGSVCIIPRLLSVTLEDALHRYGYIRDDSLGKFLFRCLELVSVGSVRHP